MKYTLYRATDTRDNKPMLWLTRGVWPERQLALFADTKTHSVIKGKTAVNPESIIWEPTTAWYEHADLSTAKKLGEWEFSV